MGARGETRLEPLRVPTIASVGDAVSSIGDAAKDSVGAGDAPARMSSADCGERRWLRGFETGLSASAASLIGLSPQGALDASDPAVAAQVVLVVSVRAPNDSTSSMVFSAVSSMVLSMGVLVASAGQACAPAGEHHASSAASAAIADEKPPPACPRQPYDQEPSSAWKMPTNMSVGAARACGATSASSTAISASTAATNSRVTRGIRQGRWSRTGDTHSFYCARELVRLLFLGQAHLTRFLLGT